MKILQTTILLSEGRFKKSASLKQILKDIQESIFRIEHPKGSEKFILHDQCGKKRGEGNGVKPIKLLCMKYLKDRGWDLETRQKVSSESRPGPIDATYPVRDKSFCFEWETGNISSSHRSLNKMALGILKGTLIGGVLVLPSRKMYHYLTDRIGNFQEIEPYLPLWKSLNVKEGYLAIIEIEHDGVSKKVKRIPKGTDGRALN
ncbi:MAG: restriction endonuclease [Candidatus Omnitrophota bacterium]